jgi:glycosyl transferase family 2
VDLAQRIEQVQITCEALGVRLDHLGRAQAGLVDVQAEMRSRLRRNQALTARTYEALAGWPHLLAAAREREGYELAYTEREPLVSIPIPTYHSPETLCDVALASVRRQTYTNWEAIVVGDHCTDHTEERVRAIGDPRIRFHNLPVREPDPEDPFERWAVKGSIPRAMGMEMANGKWIAPLSHDDEWDDDHLQTLLAAAQETRAEIAYSRMRKVDSSARGSDPVGSVGTWPPRAGHWSCQSAVFHAELRFLRPSRTCALASEANDWNLARRAWEAGVRFQFVDRETSTLFIYPRWEEISAQYHELGLPPSAAAAP